MHVIAHAAFIDLGVRSDRRTFSRLGVASADILSCSRVSLSHDVAVNLSRAHAGALCPHQPVTSSIVSATGLGARGKLHLLTNAARKPFSYGWWGYRKLGFLPSVLSRHWQSTGSNPTW